MTPQRKNTPTPHIPIDEFAERMRIKPTRCEELMYNALLATFKPYRATVHPQEPIGPYIADFFIAPSNIVVEVDGWSHADARSQQHDQRRDTFMRNRQIRVLRFKNRQVLRNPAACALYVLQQCGILAKRSDKLKIQYCPPADVRGNNSKQIRRIFWRA